jgi:hypothetical protein
MIGVLAFNWPEKALAWAKRATTLRRAGIFMLGIVNCVCMCVPKGILVWMELKIDC